MIQDTRVTELNARSIVEGARYVLYWMQQSQRAGCNHALEYAIGEANRLKLPVVVGFGLMDDYPEANLRHYQFMLEGLADTRAALRERGMELVIRRGAPAQVAIQLAREAALVVCDRGYLLHQRRWRDEVADAARCRVLQVESDVVVPVEVVSQKAEYAARTIRPRVQRHLAEYLVPLKETRPRVTAPRLKSDVDLDDIEGALRALKLDPSVRPVRRLRGGTTEARRLLREFLQERLKRYGEGRNEPSAGIVSYMAAYLHFGQISPLEIALAVKESGAPKASIDAYLEQLIVRRELGCNYVTYMPNYGSYEAVPAWARRSLESHVRDPRPVLYSREQLERAQTHDPYWNAAMHEMLRTGYMHNYMRMYWGKCVIAWKAHPREAFEDLLYLNNKYFLCGRDPNAYMNVAWCFGLHDRPWTNRPIYGQVRYMNSAGLDRKFDMAAYVAQVEQLVSAEQA